MTTPPTLAFVEERHSHHSRLYPGLLGAVGVLLVAFHAPHLVADVTEGMGAAAIVTGAVVPLLLAFGIAASGYRLWRSQFRPGQQRRVAAWFLTGTAALLLASGGFVFYQLLEGARLTHVRYLLSNFATVGGGAGLLVGWYDARIQQHSEQLRIFKQVVEYTGHNVYLTTPDGTIEYTNSAFETQTGYDSEEAVGETPRILNSGVHDDEFYAEMWETIQSGAVWRSELVNERKDGSRYWVDQTIAPVTDSNGDIEHFVAINTEITKLKEYQADLERQNERLNEFASVVSHDLRNPLNVAAGRIDLARTGGGNEHLDHAKRAIDRMEQLIDDVLALARQGETIDETERVSLRSVSEAAWAQVDAPGARLSVETDHSIHADPSRVQQLLGNLFRNAVEHGSTSPGSPAREDTAGDAGGTITIRVGTFDGGFYVEDTGAGFPDGAAEQYFESGYTTAEDGTGLGLAIVQRIAEAHGWECTATRGTDGGARIEFDGVGHEPRQAVVG